MKFRRKNKVTDQPLKVEAAKRIANFLLKIQARFSEVMNAVVKNIPLKKMKIIVVVFYLLSAGYSIYVGVDSVLGDKKSVIRIDRVQVPVYNKDVEVVDETVLQQIYLFESYLDSLSQNSSGLALYDSIMLTRPGLMDSIKLFKEIYKSQK